MQHLVRTALIVAGAVAVAAARPHAAPNPWTIVVSNGPNAGTYSAKATEVICLHAKAQKFYAASFRDFTASTPHSLAEGGIKVDNPDVAGAKLGDLHVAFGTDAKRTAVYDAYGVPIAMTTKGGDKYDLVGSGKTKEGIQLKISASCADIEAM